MHCMLTTSQDRAKFVVRAVANPAELEQLWMLDRAAYAQASITYEQFLGWWNAFPPGLKALFSDSKVMGAIGIWPLSDQWATRFKNGQTREAELPPEMLRAFQNSAAKAWYCSGIVLKPELRKSPAIQCLLTRALKQWLEDGHTEYPLELLALAYSDSGEALLKRSGFLRLQNASCMADGFPLYGVQLPSKMESLRVFNRTPVKLIILLNMG